MGGAISEGVIVPLFRALVTGILAGAVSWSVGSLWGWTQPTETALVVGSIAALLAWLRDYRPEEMSQPVTSFESEPAQSVVIVPDGANGYKRITGLFDVVDRERFALLADGVVNGGLSFTLANFSGPSGLLSRGELENLRALLLSRGMLRERVQNSPNHGFEWTRGGRALVSYYAELASTPTLVDPGDAKVVEYPRLDANHTNQQTHA